jgi:hypothetical protein
MKKILTAHLLRYRNEGHYGFMRKAFGLMAASAAVKALVAALLVTFERLLGLEKALVDVARKSNLTQLLKEADSRVDRALTGIRETVAAGLHHFDPAIVRVATELHNRLVAFGDIAKKAYEEEAATVSLLLGELQTTLTAQVSALSLGPWVTELAAALAAFEELLQERFAEAAAKPTENLLSIKKQLDACFHAIAEKVNAAAIMDAESEAQQATIADYENFITLLNAEIAYFNEHDEHRRAKQSIDGVNVEAIAPQAHTGEPVIVLPAVSLAGKKLRFSVDYTLSYRHNVKVGVADVIIRGKGGYKGQRVVTFSIG